MFSPPTPPPWEGLHPLVVHFPIALLLVSALFVLLGAIFPARGWWLRCTALILLGLGTAGAYTAFATGIAARDVVEDGPDEMWPALEEHEAMAKTTRNVFSVLTVIYAILLVVPIFWKTLSRAVVFVPLQFVFLAVLMVSNLQLANTAHIGGRLVHEFGVRAMLGADPAAAEESDE